MIEQNTGQNATKAWLFKNILLEQYCYAPGPAESLPKHCHEEYQIYIDGGLSREFFYRGTYYSAPSQSLGILYPGEVHSVCDLEERQVPVLLRLLYIPPDFFKESAAEVAVGKTHLLFFPDPFIHDPTLIQLVLKCFSSLSGKASSLEKESLLLTMSTQLISHYANIPKARKPVRRELKPVQRVRDYLREHYAEDITLTDLAQVAHLSPYHLNRVFHAEVGMPPHKYQTQIRVSHASKLLARGMPIAEVAAETGFTDQSHFTRHFRRLMQVTPGRYCR